MAETKVILIQSILGGHAPTTHFAGNGQFKASLGIDPSQPINDTDTVYSTIASGLLRPTAVQNLSSSTITKAPMWMQANPKDSFVYVSDYQSSVYTLTTGFSAATALSDGGTMTNGTGNGQAYYDNYVYFAKNTTIARYGPLNGTAAFNGDYWVTTLAKTSLNNTTYPTDFRLGLKYPNHVLHRHVDRLYIADVVGNIGELHYISTTKTSVEGDTDNLSTYGAVSFGYGLYPTAMESYGSDLAVALYEGSGASLRQTKARMSFWDTSSSNPTLITTVEFPDNYISALKNVNGTMFCFSGNVGAQGFRITKFVGGYSFQEVFYSEVGEPPFPGAVDAVLNTVLAGTYTTVPESAASVFSVGLQKSILGNGIFNVMRDTAPTIGSVTSMCIPNAVEMGFYVPIVGWAGDGQFGIDKQLTTYGTTASVWWSSLFRIGQKFKITKIRIPLAQTMAANMIVTPTIYVDDGVTSYVGGVKNGLSVMNNTNYPGAANIVMRPENLTGNHNFWIELRWTGSVLCTVGLPIAIEYELLDD